MSEPICALGADVSPTHAGLVMLGPSGDEPVTVWFVTSTKKDAERKGGTRLPPEYASAKSASRLDDPGARTALRLRWMSSWFGCVLAWARAVAGGVPLYVGLEDYAMGMEQGSHQIGEAGGAFKLQVLAQKEDRLRLHEPLTVKMFATGRGDERAKDVIGAAVKARWGQDFSRYGAAAEDLADAYVVAQMVRLEAQVRTGLVALRDCNEAALRVFNRVTKAYPVSVLGRDWIALGGAP